MGNLVAFANANLPSAKSLADSLRTLKASAGIGDGTAILKMDKTGHWVFGSDQTEVEDDAKWAINPFSFTHGYIAWGEGEVLGEIMAPVTAPLPEIGPAPDGCKRGWEPQIGFSLKCVSGEDKDLDLRYSVTSFGGRKAANELAVKIAEQVDKDQSRPVPVVLLKKDHYMHKSYGRIYTPVFDVVEWWSMGGEPPEAAQPEKAAEAAPVEETGRRRRRSV